MGIYEKHDIYWNYILFCVLYSIAHASVDAVLAYSTAELGNIIGSNGSFCLYIFYTASALLLAKPVLRYFGAKNSLFIGLCGLLLYVFSFVLSIQLPRYASIVFTIGASIGGLGAGLLWTAQGSYYSRNALIYSTIKNSKDSIVKIEEGYDHCIIQFASIFAGIYLTIESVYKVFATIVYLSYHGEKDNFQWKNTVFSLYAISAYISVVFFGLFVSRLSLKESLLTNVSHTASNATSALNDMHRSDDKSSVRFHSSRISSTVSNEEDNTAHEQSNFYTSKRRFLSTMRSGFDDMILVMKAISREPLLQLMIPYQVCFGFSSAFLGYYVNKYVVAEYLGIDSILLLLAIITYFVSFCLCFFKLILICDGYIGILSAISTATAAAISIPIVCLSKLHRGKWYVMIIGSICFFFTGSLALLMSDKKLSQWGNIIIYYILHGVARGVWENTNKAVISEYFSDYTDVAFGAVYFSSGLSGAMGYYIYKYMTRFQMSLLNTLIPLIALFCYHFSERMFFNRISNNNQIDGVSILCATNKNNHNNDCSNSSTKSNSNLIYDKLSNISDEHKNDGDSNKIKNHNSGIKNNIDVSSIIRSVISGNDVDDDNDLENKNSTERNRNYKFESRVYNSFPQQDLQDVI